MSARKQGRLACLCRVPAAAVWWPSREREQTGRCKILGPARLASPRVPCEVYYQGDPDVPNAWCPDPLDGIGVLTGSTFR